MKDRFCPVCQKFHELANVVSVWSSENTGVYYCKPCYDATITEQDKNIPTKDLNTTEVKTA